MQLLSLFMEWKKVTVSILEKLRKKEKHYQFKISISVLTNELNEVFLKLINRWDYDPRAARILKIIFEYVSRK